MWEPTVLFRAGWENVMFNVQYNYAAGLTNPELHRSKYNFSFGVTFRATTKKNSMYVSANYMRIVLLPCFTVILLMQHHESSSQSLYPPLTKWYQDPLGMKPLELSSAFGFVWGSAGMAACLLLTKKDSSLQQQVTFYQEAGYSFSYKFPYTNSLQNEVGIMINLRKWISAGLGWNLFHFSDKINNTLGFGFRPFARWYPFAFKKAKIFFEYGAGASYSFDKFPMSGTGWESDTARIGTRFNFTTKYGIGVEIKINKTVSLQSGLRHFHLSNGNLAGIQRNPSYDGNGFFAGLLYRPVQINAR